MTETREFPNMRWLHYHLLVKRNQQQCLFGKDKHVIVNPRLNIENQMKVFTHIFGGEIACFFPVYLRKQWYILIPCLEKKRYYSKVTEFINFISSDRYYEKNSNGCYGVSISQVSSCKKQIKESLSKYLHSVLIKINRQKHLKKIMSENLRKNGHLLIISKQGLTGNFTIIDYIFKFLDTTSWEENILWSFTKGSSKIDQIFFELFWSEKIDNLEKSLGQKTFRKLNKYLFQEKLSQDLEVNLVIGRNPRFLFWLSGILYDVRIFHLAPMSLQEDPNFIRLSILKNHRLLSEIWIDTPQTISQRLYKEDYIWLVKKKPDVLNSPSFPEQLKTTHLIYDCLIKKTSRLEEFRFFEDFCQQKKTHLGDSVLTIVNNNRLNTSIDTLACELCSNVKKYPNNRIFGYFNIHKNNTKNSKCPFCRGSGYSPLSSFISRLKGEKGKLISCYFKSLPFTREVSEVLTQRVTQLKAFKSFLRVMIVSSKMNKKDVLRGKLVSISLRCKDKLSLRIIFSYVFGPEFYNLIRKI